MPKELGEPAGMMMVPQENLQAGGGMRTSGEVVMLGMPRRFVSPGSPQAGGGHCPQCRETGEVCPGCESEEKIPAAIWGEARMVPTKFLAAPIVGNPNGLEVPFLGLPTIAPMFPSLTKYPWMIQDVPQPQPKTRCRLIDMIIVGDKWGIPTIELPPLQTESKIGAELPSEWTHADTWGWHRTGPLLKQVASGLGVRLFFRVYVRFAGGPSTCIRVTQFLKGMVYSHGVWKLKVGPGPFQDTDKTDPNDPPEGKWIEDSYVRGKSPFQAEGTLPVSFYEYWDAPGPLPPNGINYLDWLKGGKSPFKLRYWYKQVAEVVETGEKIETTPWLMSFDVRWSDEKNDAVVEYLSPDPGGFSAYADKRGTAFIRGRITTER